MADVDNLPEAGLKDHIVIAGAGRVGLYVARILQQLRLEFVLIELDYRVAESAKLAGMPVLFGDASDEIALEAARTSGARMLLLTTTAITTTREIVDQARRLNPELDIVARAESVDAMHVLHDHGVYEVVQPEFEAGLEMTRQALLHFDLPPVDILKFTDSIRHELYAPLVAGRENYPVVARLQNAGRLIDVTWVEVEAQSPLIGRTIEESRVRSLTGALIVGVLTDGGLIRNPERTYVFAAGDMIAVVGDAGQVEAFQALAGTRWKAAAD